MRVTILATRLRKARLAKGLTQKAAGEAVGTSNANISAYETSKREPDWTMIGKLATLYGCSADYLIGLVDNPEPYPRMHKDGPIAKLLEYLQSNPPSLEDVELIIDFLESRRLRREKEKGGDD